MQSHGITLSFHREMADSSRELVGPDITGAVSFESYPRFIKGGFQDYEGLIMITAFVGQAILLEASLSYLGLGVQEPTPAWGLMLQGGAEEYAESAPDRHLPGDRHQPCRVRLQSVRRRSARLQGIDA
jgi:hypothetical protein